MHTFIQECSVEEEATGQKLTHIRALPPCQPWEPNGGSEGVCELQEAIRQCRPSRINVSKGDPHSPP